MGKRRGRIRGGKVVTYDLINNGKVEYKGVTNNPRARYLQHKKSGKKFQWLRVTSRALNRWVAGRKETTDLIKYKRKHRRRPRYNRTWNGKFKKW